jgi:uncharacterized membrane protein YphA (DoxX/SURF4 family)
MIETLFTATAAIVFALFMLAALLVVDSKRGED